MRILKIAFGVLLIGWLPVLAVASMSPTAKIGQMLLAIGLGVAASVSIATGIWLIAGHSPRTMISDFIEAYRSLEWK